MEIIEQYVFEVGDVFEGDGEGGGFIPSIQYKSRMLVASNRYSMVVEVDSVTKTVTISGEGLREEFLQEVIVDNLKRGNLSYRGNVNKGDI